MPSLNACLTELAAQIVTLFVDKGIPLDADNTKDYLTMPSDESPSPYWCIVAGIRSIPEPGSIGQGGLVSRAFVLLCARLSRDDDAETSRREAETWINDAEETLVLNLDNPSEGEYDEHWVQLTIIQVVRDADRSLMGKFRTSHIVLDILRRSSG